jgi:broad specificity phosphatase PhoE
MTKLIIVMIGLPARGKTFMSQKLYRYYGWKGINTRIFNVGNKRRELYEFTDSVSFFNEENINQMNKVAKSLLTEMIQWIIQDDNKIAIFDATNSNKERRSDIINTIDLFKIDNLRVCFIESYCDISDIIDKNIEMKMLNPDYKHKPKKDALKDFNERMIYYIRNYEEFKISEIKNKPNYSYLKITNINQLYKIYNVVGSHLSNLMSFMLNINIKTSKIYLTRHGESIFNTKNLIGGDSSLSDKGRKYSQELYNYLNHLDGLTNMDIYTSTLKRSKETSTYFRKLSECNNNITISEKKCLDEIDAGTYDSMTYTDIKEKYPDDFELRKKDKLNYRYPMGESYKDLIQRLEGFIVDLESNDRPVLIIGHQAIIRVIYAYLMNIPLDDIPHLEVPLHCLIQLTPYSHYYHETKTFLNNY